MKLYKILFENELNSNYIIYFDMDGVLADFEGGTQKDEEFKTAKTKFDNLLAASPHNGKTEAELEQLFKGKQTDPIMAELKKAYQAVDKASYKSAGKEGFFLNLDPYPGAREMLVFAKNLTGKLPNILTAPVKSDFCEKEKEEWMQKHFSGLYDRFICNANKYEEAKEGSILIDDKEKYIGPFIEKGGIGILHTVGDSQGTINKLKQIVSGA